MLRVLHPQPCVSVAYVEGEGALIIITPIIITPDSTAELEELGMMMWQEVMKDHEGEG